MGKTVTQLSAESRSVPALPSSPSAGAGYIPTLDGWRAVAISGVIICHGSPYGSEQLLLSLGHTGVLVFFVLSGFLITNRLMEEQQLTGHISLLNFYLRRFFRILPASTLYLAVITALGLAGVISFSRDRTIAAALFFRNYMDANAANGAFYTGHFWSLSVEEHFYLIWPAILVTVGVLRARRLAPVLVVALGLWRLIDEKYDFIARALHDLRLSHNGFRTDYEAVVLLIGCSAALWMGCAPWNPPGRLLKVAAYAPIFLLPSVGWVVFHRATLPWALVNLGGALLMACTVISPESFLGRILELPFFRWIGRISYGLYLWQQFFLQHGDRGLWCQQGPWRFFFILVCATLSYYCVEKPAIRLGRRIISGIAVKRKGARTLLSA